MQGNTVLTVFQEESASLFWKSECQIATNLGSNVAL